LKKLVAYITSGYPEKNFNIDLSFALAKSGVDTLELGIAFSDPVADGVIIEKANQIALKNGYRFSDTLDITKAISKDIDTMWMGYFNSFYQQDFKALMKKAKDIGISGFIIPDLPYEEAKFYKDDLDSVGLSNITFVAPTDTKDRIELLVKDSSKFIYLVAYTGITGSGKSEDLSKIIHDIKTFSTTPVYVGFGVNAKTAKDKAKGADGVIVGSAFVEVLLDDTLSGTQKIDKCCEIAKAIKDKINS
jgi:tryptophan synthase alpha chain